MCEAPAAASPNSPHAAAGSATMAAPSLPTLFHTDAEWDIGNMVSGELVMELRFRLNAVALEALFHLMSRDPGAPEDLPAWCRLIEHTLVRAEHPKYWRKG